MSLCCEPVIFVPANPDPISKPFADGIDNIACASSASSLSKHGSPNPTSTRRTTHLITPPVESLAALSATMCARIAAAAFSHGQRTSLLSTCNRVTCSSSNDSPKSAMLTAPTDVTKATISMPKASRSHFSATAPAATRAIVSLALARPPPDDALMPYLAM